MRITHLGIAIVLVGQLTTAAALATGPTYDGYLKWVEDHNPKDTTPKEKRVFIAYSNQWSLIVAHSADLSVRGLIDQTKAKGTEVRVRVFREGKRKPVLDLVMRPIDAVIFQLFPRDVVLLTDPRAPA